MLENIISEKNIVDVKTLLEESKKCVILTHSRPDGDAMGSSLALAGFLKARGKDVSVVVPNEYPPFLAWLPGIDSVTMYDKSTEAANEILNAADLFFCLDFNALSRIDAAGKVVESLPAKRVLIDHHLAPEPTFDITISHPEACSTSELVFRLFRQMGASDEVTKPMAECIYAGIMTDTGNFAYASGNKDIYIIVAELISKGIDKDLIYRRVFYNYSFGRMKLIGYMMYRKLRYFTKNNAALLTLTYEEAQNFNCSKGDTEGIVNMPLQIKGVRFTCFFREEIPGKINVSLRSVDNFPCNKVAEMFFNGGGHKNAAGGEVRGPMGKAVKIFHKVLAQFSDELTK